MHTNIAFNTIELNEGSAFDGTTFTAPRAGRYHFYSQAFSQPDRTRFRITRGGAYLADGWIIVSGNTVTPAVTALLAEGDLVRCELIEGSVWAGNNTDGMIFGGHWVG